MGSLCVLLLRGRFGRAPPYLIGVPGALTACQVIQV